MRILDSRRLVGPNLQMERPGAVAEVAFEPGEEPESAIALWQAEALAAAKAIGLPIEELRARRFSGGAALSFAAPLDALLAASDLNDVAIARAGDRLAGRDLGPLENALLLLRESLAAQRSPRLLALEAECARRELPLMLDDSAATIGMGPGSRTWPLEALPAPHDVPWDSLARVPVALITGTNGKTTSARLLAHLLASAGKKVGLAATDFVSIAGEIVERGDFTGPAAARMVLRDPRIEVAVLETARGGILRRGLAFDRADCALLTNVADDHLGEYGIDSVRQLARAKAVVLRAVMPSGRIAMNADDPESVALFRDDPALFRAPITWFSLEPEKRADLLGAHLQAGGEALLLVDRDGVETLVRRRQASPDAHMLMSAYADEVILGAREIPISFGGAARFNLSNALGASALAFALGLDAAQIARGLASFRPDGKDNPGRGNLMKGPDGVQVLLDFGHNAHGVRQLAPLVSALRAGGPLTTLAACAGDRSDDNLRALAEEIAAMRPRRVLLRDLPDYLRGRQPGEVPAKLTALLAGRGLEGQVSIHESEAISLATALDSAQAGELILLLVHLDDEAVRALLEARGFTAG